MDWIFKRPPYSPFVEVAGKADRFELRVVLRVDQALLTPAQMDQMATAQSEALHGLEEHMRRVFPDFLLDSVTPEDARPFLSEATVEGMTIIVGVNYKRRRKGS